MLFPQLNIEIRPQKSVAEKFFFKVTGERGEEALVESREMEHLRNRQRETPEVFGRVSGLLHD